MNIMIEDEQFDLAPVGQAGNGQRTIQIYELTDSAGKWFITSRERCSCLGATAAPCKHTTAIAAFEDEGPQS